MHVPFILQSMKSVRVLYKINAHSVKYVETFQTLFF